MPFLENNVKKIVSTAVILSVLLLAAAYFFDGLKPVSGFASDPIDFRVDAGDGFFKICGGLAGENLIKSKSAFELLAILTGSAGKLKPGLYRLSQSMSGGEILDYLVSGSRREISVTIPEGASVYEVDKILSDAGVIEVGSLVNLAKKENLEGRLFPDTYNFFTGSNANSVAEKFFDNFRDKAWPILAKSPANATSALILASLLEREVPGLEDQKIIAGILQKRLKAGMPLQIDATICYVKEAMAYPGNTACYPLTALDFKLESPYNTYLYAGLPPGPIGSPSISAITAALNPKSSPYWFYLSDPTTHKTIFSQTLDEQEQNRVKYLLKG
jgi:UPF0755 protein